MSSINDQLNEGQKQYGASSSSYFKFENGDNRIRVLTEGEIIATHFFGPGVKPSTCYGIDNGCPFHGAGATKDKDGKEKKSSIKYTSYVVRTANEKGEFIEDKDKIVELTDLPYSVAKQIGDYQENIDYAFSVFPMPYDVTVKYDKNAGSPNDKYKVFPSPKREEVTDVVKGMLAEAMSNQTPQDHVAKKKAWQMEDHKKRGIWKEVKKMTNEEMNKEFADKVARGEVANPEEESVPYPDEDIKPEDIPF